MTGDDWDNLDAATHASGARGSALWSGTFLASVCLGTLAAARALLALYL